MHTKAASPHTRGYYNQVHPKDAPTGRYQIASNNSYAKLPGQVAASEENRRTQQEGIQRVQERLQKKLEKKNRQAEANAPIMAATIAIWGRHIQNGRRRDRENFPF